MSSLQTKLPAVAMKQFRFKLQANMGRLATMVALQMVAVLFASGGNLHIASGFFSIKFVSNTLVFIFTAGLAFFLGILLTTKSHRDVDFYFVSNRVAGNLANIGFLVSYSFLGGVTCALASVLIRVMGYFLIGKGNIVGSTFFVSPWDFTIGMAAIILYILLICAGGYFLGSVYQVTRIYAFLLTGVLLGIWFALDLAVNPFEMVWQAVEFFIRENSLALLAVKVLSTAGMLLLLSTVLTNKLEVRK